MLNEHIAPRPVLSFSASNWLRTFCPRGYMFLIVVVVGALVLYPVGMLLWGSFRTSPPGEAGSFTLQNYIVAYSSPYFLQVVLNSLFIGLAVTFFSITLGVFFTWVVTRTDTPGARLLETGLTINYFLPTLLLVVAWNLLASPRSGSLNKLLQAAIPGLPPIDVFSYGGIVWVMLLHFVPLVVILVGPTFRAMDPVFEEASQMSGRGQWPTWLKITLPLALPAILSATLLVFVRAIENFDVPLFYGNPARIYVFMNLIYNKLNGPIRADYAGATALAVTVMAVTFLLAYINLRLLGNRSFAVVTGRGYRPRALQLGKWRYMTFAIAVVFLSLSVVFPVIQIILTSFSKVSGIYRWENFTLDNYTAVFNDRPFWRALTNTLYISAVSAVTCMLISLVIVYTLLRTKLPGRRLLEALSWVPWSIPGAVLAVGMLWGYIYLPLIYGTPWVLILAFITFGLPLGVRAVHSTLIQINVELEEAAQVHGGNFAYSMRRIVLPLLRNGLVAGTVLLFVMFTHILSIPAFLSTSRSQVLSVVMLDYWSNGQIQKVSVVALIMVAIMLAVMALERSLRGSRG